MERTFCCNCCRSTTCDEDTNGRLYYVEADNQFQVCKTAGWSVIDIQGADGVDGASGSDGADGQDGLDGTPGSDGLDGQDGVSTLIRVLTSSSCATGGNSFEIGPDNNGDGALDITEIALTVDICDGAQGPAGPPGADGADGADGAAGQDGPPGPQGPAGNDGSD